MLGNPRLDRRLAWRSFMCSGLLVGRQVGFDGIFAVSGWDVGGLRERRQRRTVRTVAPCAALRPTLRARTRPRRRRSSCAAPRLLVRRTCPNAVRRMRSDQLERMDSAHARVDAGHTAGRSFQDRLTALSDCAFNPRSLFRSFGVVMTRRSERAGSGGRRYGFKTSGAIPSLPSPVRGRVGRGRPVERREAQRPAGRPRKPAGFWARASRKRASQARLFGARTRSLASFGKGPRKPLAPPGAPFLWERKRERRTRRDQTTRAAERWLFIKLVLLFLRCFWGR